MNLLLLEREGAGCGFRGMNKIREEIFLFLDKYI